MCHGGHRPDPSPPESGAPHHKPEGEAGGIAAAPCRARDRRPCPRRSGYMYMYAMHGNALREFPK